LNAHDKTRRGLVKKGVWRELALIWPDLKREQ
jgi:hypothetical protein